MKAVRKLVLLTTSTLLVAAASATTSEQSYLETCRKDPGVPVPIVVVAPSVGAEYEGSSVHLEFVVDAKGKPGQFAIKSAPDDILATKVVEAVRQWRFQPAEIDGTPVAMKVALPVRIVEATPEGPRLAARD